MKLIIGLGNPGTKYERTRHNFGFLAIDCFHKNFPGLEPWSMDKSANALMSKGQTGDEHLILAKPQTFMNLSGTAAANLANFYKISTQDIWVVHDDYDLPLGIIRLSRGASCAGHKGVRSIIEALGTKDFVRIRLGIHPVGKTFFSVLFKKMLSIEKFVLKNFDKQEQKTAEEITQKTSQTIELALKEGIEQAMSQFN
ncbi:MAG: aminoacyl-tRNA hydrolase [bacterium]